MPRSRPPPPSRHPRCTRPASCAASCRPRPRARKPPAGSQDRAPPRLAPPTPASEAPAPFPSCPPPHTHACTRMHTHTHTHTHAHTHDSRSCVSDTTHNTSLHSTQAQSVVSSSRGGAGETGGHRRKTKPWDALDEEWMGYGGGWMCGGVGGACEVCGAAAWRERTHPLSWRSCAPWVFP